MVSFLSLFSNFRSTNESRRFLSFARSDVHHSRDYSLEWKIRAGGNDHFDDAKLKD